jgi:hypothetical protein
MLIGLSVLVLMASNVYAQVVSSFTISENVFIPAQEGTVSINFTPTQGGAGQLYLYNAAGELIRSWNLGVLSAAPQSISWNGRNAQNQLVASGIYFFYLELPLGSVQKDLLVVR